MRYVVLAVLTLLIVCCKETTSFEIEGIVYNGSLANPVQDVRVQLARVGFTVSDLVVYDETVTDEVGHYRIEYTLEDECRTTIHLLTEKSGYITSGSYMVDCHNPIQIKNISIICADPDAANCD